MKRIATLIQRVRQRTQNKHESDAAVRFVDNRDRSSMADFVRILQAQDHHEPDRNSA